MLTTRDIVVTGFLVTKVTLSGVPLGNPLIFSLRGYEKIATDVNSCHKQPVKTNKNGAVKKQPKKSETHRK